MADSANLTKLKGILSKMANLIREAEGHSDPVLVADMRQKVAEMDIATFSILSDMVTSHTVKDGATDPSTPTDTLDYYRKLLTNFANKVRTDENKLTIDQIAAQEDLVCGVHKDQQGKYGIRIPESVTSIGDSAFYRCYSLTSIIIPENVTRIGGGAFAYCSSLASITIPENVTWIGGFAFDGCLSLDSVIIPEGVTSIGDHTFNRCLSLDSVIIPEGVTSIDTYAFSECGSLTSVTLPENLMSIGAGAFQDCILLASITIPENVTSIGDFAFRGCSSLTSVIIPESVESIGIDVFDDCDGLESISYGGTTDQCSFFDWPNILGSTNIPYIHCIDGDYEVPQGGGSGSGSGSGAGDSEY